VTNVSVELVVTALNDAHDTKLDASVMRMLGLEKLRMECEFNKAVGFTEKDDELPELFCTGPSLRATRPRAITAPQPIGACASCLPGPARGWYFGRGSTVLNRRIPDFAGSKFEPGSAPHLCQGSYWVMARLERLVRT
jgi:hypothetical protein